MARRSPARDDLDSPWKETLQRFLRPFLEFFYPPVAADIDIYPLCPQRRALMSAMHMGACVKTVCVYPSAFWRTTPGKLLPDVHYSEMGPASNVFDATIGHQPALVGLVVGDAARTWAARGEAALQAAITGQYARMFDCESALKPTHFIAKSWMEEPLSKGCYAALMGPGVMTAYGPALFAPSGAVHWAGTEAATAWPGYFEGAVQAGYREAEQVVVALSKAKL